MWPPTERLRKHSTWSFWVSRFVMVLWECQAVQAPGLKCTALTAAVCPGESGRASPPRSAVLPRR